MGLIFSIVVLVVVVAALVDIIVNPEPKHLPKLVWVLLVVLLPLIGSVVWFLVGHDWGSRPEAISFGDPRRQEQAVARHDVPPRGELSTEAQLAALDAEIEAAEKQERIRRLEAQLEAKRADAAE